MWIDIRLCGVADGRRRGPKTLLGPGKVGRRPETTDTPCRSCIVEGNCSQGAGQEKVNAKNRERTDIPKGTPEEHGVQKWHMGSRLTKATIPGGKQCFLEVSTATNQKGNSQICYRTKENE
jgi:hypothetical protein